ncbi:MAG: regulatory protein GemA [Rhizomicrobium sp.]
MTAVSPARRAKLGLVHSLAAKAGLDDDARRDAMFRLTGQRSARDCSDAQLDAIIAELDGAKFHGKQKANNSYTAKTKALWIACWNLGALQAGDDRALDAFVKRQTGKDRLAFVTPGEANAVTEALKSLLGRHGCDVPAGDVGGLIARRNLVRAQWARLGELGAIKALVGLRNDWALDAYARKVCPGAFRGVDDFTAKELDQLARAWATSCARRWYEPRPAQGVAGPPPSSRR